MIKLENSVYVVERVGVITAMFGLACASIMFTYVVGFMLYALHGVIYDELPGSIPIAFIVFHIDNILLHLFIKQCQTLGVWGR
jgi:hypothetical protein